MVLDRIKSLLGMKPKPAGAPERVRGYTLSDYPVAQDLAVEEDAWRIEFTEARVVNLFEMAQPEIDNAVLTFRAQVRTDNMQGPVYLEMSCHSPDGGESAAREDVPDRVSGTTDWSTHEIAHQLKPGERPDVIKMNVAGQGAGTVWVKDVELLKTPLK
jgi:hypothetical protein